MAITDISTARIIRSHATDRVDSHAFSSVSDLPTVVSGRPGKSDNPALDAIRAAAWDEGFVEGRSAGIDDGYAVGFERGAAEGREAGYRDGRASAEQDALAVVQDRFTSALGALEAATHDLQQHDRRVLSQMEEAVIDLGLAVAQAVLDREIQTASDPGRDALSRALALAGDEPSYIARLNPADLERIGEVADLAPGRTMNLAADPSVSPGGCVIEAGAARVDAQIETALARVREVLRP